jgi:pimeloyl-ACP methyl ester carboxylesterase
MDVLRRIFTLMLLALMGLSSAVQAKPLNNPPAESTNPLDSESVISDLMSISSFTPGQNNQYEVSFILTGGLKIGGLLYVDPSQGTRPLVIADFGLLSSRENGLGEAYVQKIFFAGKLNANLLILDDVTGSDFYLNNNRVSLGGYEAGRVLVLLAEALQKSEVPFSSLHLLGESLGGLAVWQALLEDARVGKNYFKSAISFSGVVDEASSTASVMSSFGYHLSNLSGPSLSWLGGVFLEQALLGFDEAIGPSQPANALLSVLDAGAFFYERFAQALRQTAPENWNPEVKRDSVESYLETSSALVQKLKNIRVPYIVVHAQNDPVVDFAQFESFAGSQAHNPNVLTLATPAGSHCGFIGAYGADWVADLLNRNL